MVENKQISFTQINPELGRTANISQLVRTAQVLSEQGKQKQSKKAYASAAFLQHEIFQSMPLYKIQERGEGALLAMTLFISAGNIPRARTIGRNFLKEFYVPENSRQSISSLLEVIDIGKSL